MSGQQPPARGETSVSASIAIQPAFFEILVQLVPSPGLFADRTTFLGPKNVEIFRVACEKPGNEPSVITSAGFTMPKTCASRVYPLPPPKKWSGKGSRAAFAMDSHLGLLYRRLVFRGLPSYEPPDFQLRRGPAMLAFRPFCRASHARRLGVWGHWCGVDKLNRGHPGRQTSSPFGSKTCSGSKKRCPPCRILPSGSQGG